MSCSFWGTSTHHQFPPMGLERRELLNGLKINGRAGMEQKPLRKPKKGKVPQVVELVTHLCWGNTAQNQGNSHRD